MTFSRTDEKYQTLETHLSQDQYLMVHLNPTYPGVLIPENFLASPTLTLKLSYNFQGVTVITPELITAELMFNGKHFSCRIPLAAIWGCTTIAEKNFIWPESLSANSYESLATEMESIKKPKLAVNKQEDISTPSSNLKKIESDPKQEEPVAENKKRPNLTRIK